MIKRWLCYVCCERSSHNVSAEAEPLLRAVTDHHGGTVASLRADKKKWSFVSVLHLHASHHLLFPFSLPMWILKHFHGNNTNIQAGSSAWRGRIQPSHSGWAHQDRLSPLCHHWSLLSCSQMEPIKQEGDVILIDNTHKYDILYKTYIKVMTSSTETYTRHTRLWTWVQPLVDTGGSAGVRLRPALYVCKGCAASACMWTLDWPRLCVSVVVFSVDRVSSLNLMLFLLSNVLSYLYSGFCGFY